MLDKEQLLKELEEIAREARDSTAASPAASACPYCDEDAGRCNGSYGCCFYDPEQTEPCVQAPGLSGPAAVALASLLGAYASKKLRRQRRDDDVSNEDGGEVDS